MAPVDENTPGVPVEDAETPTGEVSLEASAAGADLAFVASSPGLLGPAASAPEREAPRVEADGAEPAEGASLPGAGVLRYRPSENYAEGDRIYHPIWDAVGVVKRREVREEIFRVAFGKVEERGRCHVIHVEFEKEVPASGGPRRDVALIADWHGHAFNVGARPVATLPDPQTLLEVSEPWEERASVARARRPALPEIPEPEPKEDAFEAENEGDDEGDSKPLGL